MKIAAHELLNIVSIDCLLALAGISDPEVKTSGGWIRCRCPIHKGEDPNFSIGMDPPFKWFCYSRHCHVSSRNDGIGLLCEINGYQPSDAIMELCHAVGIDSAEIEYDYNEPDLVCNLPEDLRVLSARNSNWAEMVLSKVKPEPEPALATITMESVMRYHANGCPYFMGRGFEEDLIRHFLLGTDYNWKNCGETRATIPVLAPGGELLSIQGRMTQSENGDKKIPKYDFPKGTMRRGAVYNINEAVKNGYRGDLIVVEGAPSVWHLKRLGIDNAVATFGSTPHQEQILALVKNCERVILMSDGDKAGDSMIQRFKNLGKHMLDVWTIRYSDRPDGFEPEDLTEKKAKQALARARRV